MITSLEKQFMESVINLCRRFHNDGPDWEQRRYEIARDLFVSLHDISSLPGVDLEDCAQLAVHDADVLIAKLREVNPSE